MSLAFFYNFDHSIGSKASIKDPIRRRGRKFNKIVRDVFVATSPKIERLTMAARIFNPQHVEAVQIGHSC
ncbi:MAG: hypothetical protein AUI33_00365 [Ignavibacteria bacterium 13_1_40CM_2_61_4]|nr:MAG: hypothetical protein AUI33_00365 [Ignavibacteria bacterium 13_1_40CM_2_61_4]